MSSDYVPRLRSELLRAGAAKQARVRWTRPLAVTAGLALVALVLVLALPGGRDDEVPVQPAGGTVRITYRATPAAAEETARIVRDRLAAAGIGGAVVAVSPGGSMTITAPAAARADVTALTQRGRLAIYDWERSVLGPRGVPAPADADVTGGADAGHAAAISRSEAEARTAGRAGAPARAPWNAPDRWYALVADAALTGAEVQSARADVDPAANEPIVAVDLTARGKTAFTALTRALASRGEARAADGVSDLDANQHLAIVLDDRILAVPYIDFRQAPDGIDGAGGVQIQGGLTPRTARLTAVTLSAGPLPAALQIESEQPADR